MADSNLQEEGDFSSSFPLPDFLNEASLLRPKFDTIFAEVEQSLPDIDFEVSDVSSEEDVPIFHRGLKTPTSDDGDVDSHLDASLSMLTDNSPPTHTEDTVPYSILPPVSSQYHEQCEDSRIAKSISNLATTLGYDVADNSHGVNLSVPASQQLHVETGSNEDAPLANVITNLASTLGFDMSVPAENNRPKSAPVKSVSSCGTSTSSAGTSTDNKPNVIKEAWVSSESDNVSDRERKRQEIPELSPISRNGNEITDTKLKKGRGARQPRSNPDDIVSKYLAPMEATLNLDNINIDDLVCEALGRNQAAGGDSTSASDDPLAQQGPSSTLIQRLAEMTVVHSGTTLNNIDPHTGALKGSSASTLKHVKTERNKNVSTAGGTVVDSQTKVTNKNLDLANIPSLPKPEAPKPQNQERDTIYIDLRGFDKNKEEENQNFDTIQRILRITKQQQPESDDSDEDENEELWHEQRRRIKESLSRTGHMPTPAPVIHKPKAAAASQPSRHTQAQRLAGHLPPEGHKQQKKACEQEEEVEEQEVVPAEPTLDVHEAERLRRIQVAKKLREKKEQERQSRIRLGKRLEALRPNTSVSGKNPAAEATPTLFDVESSYEPSSETLPCNLTNPHLEYVLLTVHLSSNGEIVQHRQNKNVDSGHGFSASYTSLLTWLLTLVPDDFSFLEDTTLPPRSSANIVQPPFHVLGLQQLYVNDQLCLFVAVVPSHKVTPPNKPRKQKRKSSESKGQSAFQSAVSHFLSTNTLRSVSSWLEHLVSQEVGPPSTSDDRDTPPFIYTPPLPNITTRPLSTFMQVNPDPEAVHKIFSLPVGFFWSTVDNDEPAHEHGLSDEGVDYDTHNTMSLVYKKVYRIPQSTMGILNRVLQEGLDLAGVRLLYPTTDQLYPGAQNPSKQTAGLEDNSSSQSAKMAALNNIGPILALALRGTLARTIWLDAIGPSDPQLARRTDPNSLCALYGGQTREECLLFCPRNPARVLSELCRWFGGRVPASGVIDVGTDAGSRASSKKQANASKKVTFADEHDDTVTELPSTRPPASLAACTRSDVIVVVSPLVPTRCMGLLLATAQRRGYQLRGVRRARLNAKRVNSLGIPSSQLLIFCDSGSVPSSPTDAAAANVPFDPAQLTGQKSAVLPRRPSTVLLLNKENAQHSSASLIEAFMVQMTLQDVLGKIQASVDYKLNSTHLFHTTAATDSLINTLGGDFTKTPDYDAVSTPGYIAPQLHTNPEVEQICVLTFTSHSFMKNFGLFLGRLQDLVPYNNRQLISAVHEGFELLGIKWLPRLTLQQAKELTPCEVGDKSWKKSIHTLTSEPAVILALRGINAFQRLSGIISQRSPAGQPALDRIMSPNPNLAYRQATLFFRDYELFADPDSRSLLPYLPPVRPQDDQTDRPPAPPKGKRVPSYHDESILNTMLSGPCKLTTVLIAHPDVVAKGQVPKLLRRIAQEKFSIVGMKLAYLDAEQVQYMAMTSSSLTKDPSVTSLVVKHLTSGPCLLLCLQRENAVKRVLDLLGPLDPKAAKKESSFLWRAMFGTDSVMNGLHASPDYGASVMETWLFFPEGVCSKPTPALTSERIACPAEDPIMVTDAGRKVTYKSAGQTSSDGPVDSNTKRTGMSIGQTISGLTQTSVLLLTPTLLTGEHRSSKLPYVDIINKLSSEGFEIVGCRMVWFSRKQAEHYLLLMEAGSFALAGLLTTGPCIILAVQRDNAILAFDQHLGSSLDKDSLYSKYNTQILRPKTDTQGEKLLCYMFDNLVPSAHAQISTSDQNTL